MNDEIQESADSQIHFLRAKLSYSNTFKYISEFGRSICGTLSLS